MVSIFDAGHGGDDPGAVYSGFVEKDINLTWCKLLERTHDAHWGELGSCFLTRLEDTTLPMRRRIEEVGNGDALVSVHTNAGGGSGFEVWYTSPLGRDLAERIYDTWPGNRKRGVKHDSQCPHGRLAILRDTKPPAVLIELGFIDDPTGLDMDMIHDLEFALEASQNIIQAMEDFHVNRGD